MRLNPISYRSAAVACFLLFSTLIVLNSVSAEIYSYVDENGVLHFSNAPTSSRYRYTGPENTRYASVYYPAGPQLHAYDTIIQEAAGLYDIRFELIKAMIHAESNFDSTAISRAGAMGLMQIMPANLNALGVKDPFNPRDNVMGGTRYLKSLMTKYNSDLSLVLAAYNAGPGAVDKYRTIPPYPETQKYVSKVLSLYSRYKTPHP